MTLKKIITIFILVVFFFCNFFVMTGTDFLYAKEPAAGKKVIVIGDDINYPPYSYIDENGVSTGFNIDLAIAVCRVMGYEAEIRLDEWSKTRTALETGEIDAISGMFYSEERDVIYDFTARHSITTGDIFTRTDTTINSLNDLSGKTVVVQKGDIIAEYLKELDIGINFFEVNNVRDALKLVASGKYDYAGLVSLPGLYSIQQKDIKGIKANNQGLNPQDYCMAVKDGNENIKVILDSGLQVIKANGEYDKICEKWLGVYEEKSIADSFREFLWVIVSAVGIIVLLLIITYILKQIVNNKTEEIRKQNELLIENEKDLLKSEAKNRSIVEAIPDNVFLVDVNGIIHESHIAIEASFSMPKENFIGTSILSIVPEEISSEIIEKFRFTLEKNQMQYHEYTVNTDDVVDFFEMRMIKFNDDQILIIIRNVTTDQTYINKIEYLSLHDQLTGLYNRHFFEAELERLDNPANYPLCLVMADVNGLKLINDSFGHRMGDELLIKISKVLKDACKNDEIIFRIGGDEFIILMPNTEVSEIPQLIKKIKSLSENEKVGAVDLSISFGWDVKSFENQDIHDVFNKAENQMYKSKLFESPSMRGKTIGAIISTLNEKNKREELHSRRVSEISATFATVMGLAELSVEEIRTTGLLHDIGKIAIPEDILNNTGKLSEEEYAEIKRHPEIGYRILSSANDMSDIANYTLYHHERWDGTGYPSGKKGNEIPLESRIICIADAFDAMTSNRSYRASGSVEYAISELKRCKGTQFDPDLIDEFIEKMLPFIIRL